MKPIEISSVAASRPVGADAQRPVKGAPTASGSAATPKTEPGIVARSEALSAGPIPPVDSDRVAQIRSAIKQGNYPLLPTSVADEMIAASFILIEGKKDS